MDDDIIDIDEVADTGDYLLDDEDEDLIENEEEKIYDSKIIDVNQTFIDMKKEKTTIPKLTKYEKTRLIGEFWDSSFFFFHIYKCLIYIYYF
jgi:hypothetical protein